MAALHGAIALAQVQAHAVLVPEHLHLDVPRVFHELLEVELGGSEGGARLRLARRVGAGQRFPLAHDAHPAAAAARRRLDDDRIPHRVREGLRLVHAGERPLAARDHRRARVLGHLPGLGLVAHEADGLGGRADERDAARAADLREGGVLGQEAVAGMDGLAVGDRGRRDDARDVEVAQARLGRPDADGLVGQAHGQGVGVGGGVGDHGADSHLAARPDDPERDLAPVGDEDLVEHQPRVSAAGPPGRAAGRTRRAGRSRPGPWRCVPPPWTRSRSSASSPRRCR